jgi:predicted lipoprotein with Yx(FWY)xxD motif
MPRKLPLVLLAAPLLALAQGAPPTRLTDGAITDANGMALYVSDGDAPLRSACSGDCARAWPPLLAEGNAKPWAEYTPFARADGTRQWAYKGKPLYRHARDQTPGDRNGDGADNAWRIALP